MAHGPAAVGAFVEALLGSDPSPILAATEVVGLEAALAWLMERLDAQSHFMAKVIPAPPGATREVTLPSMEQLPEDLPMSRFMSMLGSPSAHEDLEIEGCQLVTDLSASSYALYEAREVHRWGQLHGKDGEVHNAFIRRNAERIVGDERVDGTGIEAVVDDNVVVRMCPGSAPMRQTGAFYERRMSGSSEP